MIRSVWTPGIAIGGYAGGTFGAMLFWEKGLTLSALYGTFGAVGALLAFMTIIALLGTWRASRKTNKEEGA